MTEAAGARCAKARQGAQPWGSGGVPPHAEERPRRGPEAASEARSPPKDGRRGDLFAPLTGAFDLICCNPPYIPSVELPNLQQEVRQEPALALDGGPDGLHVYRRILREAPAYLTPRGWLLLELGDGQAQALQALAQVDFDTISVYDDLSGLPRVLAARRKENNAVP